MGRRASGRLGADALNDSAVPGQDGLDPIAVDLDTDRAVWRAQEKNGRDRQRGGDRE